MRVCINCYTGEDRCILQRIDVTNKADDAVASIYCCPLCVEELKRQQIEIFIYDPTKQ